jgi:intracellular septation protein
MSRVGIQYDTRPFRQPVQIIRMNLLLDYLPIVAFVIAYKFFGIFVATGVLIVGVVALVAAQWIRHRKVNSMMLISAILVFVLGGITITLRDETFIQWKPTVASWTFALVFLASRFVGKKTMIEQMMGEIATLDSAIWHRLNYVWVVFWLIMGFANLVLLRTLELSAWVTWHLPVLLGLSVIFFLGNGYWITTQAPVDSEQHKSES